MQEASLVLGHFYSPPNQLGVFIFLSSWVMRWKNWTKPSGHPVFSCQKRLHVREFFSHVTQTFVIVVLSDVSANFYPQFSAVFFIWYEVFESLGGWGGACEGGTGLSWLHHARSQVCLSCTAWIPAAVLMLFSGLNVCQFLSTKKSRDFLD